MSKKPDQPQQDSGHYTSQTCDECHHTRGQHNIWSGVNCKIEGCGCKNFAYPAENNQEVNNEHN